MTHDEFLAAYPFAKRAECRVYMTKNEINGWAESGHFGDEERFRVKLIVAKPMAPNKKTGKRVTATDICRKLYLKMGGKHDEVDRKEFIAAAVKQGINAVTAATRYGYLKAEFGAGE